jgi:uncharacterized membrane protein
MQFFIFLVLGLLVFWAMPRRLGGRSIQDAARRSMSAAFIFAGVSHLAIPASFEEYFPNWVPFATELVYLTGVIEIAGGIGLLIRRYQAMVGIALAIYLVLIFPANIYVAAAGTDELMLPGLPEAAWYAWARLPFQFLFIWWALWSTRPSGSRALPRFSRNRLRMAH